MTIHTASRLEYIGGVVEDRIRALEGSLRFYRRERHRAFGLIQCDRRRAAVLFELRNLYRVRREGLRMHEGERERLDRSIAAMSSDFHARWLELDELREADALPCCGAELPATPHWVYCGSRGLAESEIRATYAGR